MKRTALPFLPGRVRQLPRSFSWLDRRLINDNFLAGLSREELTLYFFLVTVSNRYGVSFYGAKKICRITGLTPSELETARSGLEQHDLVAFRSPYYQVLSLPEKPVRARRA